MRSASSIRVIARSSRFASCWRPRLLRRCPARRSTPRAFSRWRLASPTHGPCRSAEAQGALVQPASHSGTAHSSRRPAGGPSQVVDCVCPSVLWREANVLTRDRRRHRIIRAREFCRRAGRQRAGVRWACVLPTRRSGRTGGSASGGSSGSVREAALVWGVSKSTAARWINAPRPQCRALPRPDTRV
jgi:hypothetical protein